jgi:hypothetical protein
MCTCQVTCGLRMIVGDVLNALAQRTVRRAACEAGKAGATCCRTFPSCFPDHRAPCIRWWSRNGQSSSRRNDSWYAVTACSGCNNACCCGRQPLLFFPSCHTAVCSLVEKEHPNKMCVKYSSQYSFLCATPNSVWSDWLLARTGVAAAATLLHSVSACNSAPALRCYSALQ